MTLEFDQINNFMEKKNIISIYELINTKQKFTLYNELLLSNYDKISDDDMVLYIKILLNRILFFEGNINTDLTENLYSKLEQNKNTNIEIINRFIQLYDEFKKIRLLLFSLTHHFIKKFKSFDHKFPIFLKKNNLRKSDINYIYNKINTNIYKYFLSFFDANSNNQFLDKLQYYCKFPKSQPIITRELLRRIKQLAKIFTLKFLQKLNIQIISNVDFINFPYFKKVQYYKSIFDKINSLFKLYTKYYMLLEELEYKLNDLVRIDIFDYYNEITDSSSFIVSDDNYQYVLNDDNDTNYNPKEINSLFVTTNNNNYKNIEDDFADTPYIGDPDPQHISDEISTIIDVDCPDIQMPENEEDYQEDYDNDLEMYDEDYQEDYDDDIEMYEEDLEMYEEDYDQEFDDEEKDYEDTEDVDPERDYEDTEDVNTEDVNTEDVNTEDVNTEDVNTEDVDTEDVDTEDVDTEDVDTEDVDTEDVDTEKKIPKRDVKSEIKQTKLKE